MGQPKLLMPWGTGLVIDHVLGVWQASQVDAIVVIARADDAELLSVLEGFDVHVVRPPCAPPEMKHSVQYGLEYLGHEFAPRDTDRWLLSPADTPMISTALIDAVLNAAGRDRQSRIVIPACDGRRGHPVAFPWTTAAQVFALRADQGVNAIVRRHAVLELPVDDAGILQDLDTPEQYRRLRGESSRPPT
jgi:molybdenum cofactor cytidylyltransferase